MSISEEAKNAATAMKTTEMVRENKADQEHRPEQELGKEASTASAAGSSEAAMPSQGNAASGEGLLEKTSNKVTEVVESAKNSLSVWCMDTTGS